MHVFIWDTCYEPSPLLNCRVITSMLYNPAHQNIIYSLVINQRVNMIRNQIFRVLKDHPVIKLNSKNFVFEYRVPASQSNWVPIRIPLSSNKILLFHVCHPSLVSPAWWCTHHIILQYINHVQAFLPPDCKDLHQHTHPNPPLIRCSTRHSDQG